MTRPKVNFSRRDLLLTILCTLFALANLGAVGSTSRRRAKEAVCLSNLRQWGAMFEAYTIDNNGYFNRGWDVGETTLWMNALRPYYAGCETLRFCPEATTLLTGPSDIRTFTAWWRFISLPEGGEIRDSGSYSINSWTNNMTKDLGSRPMAWFWKNVNAIKGKANIPVFADATWHDAWPKAYDNPPPTGAGWDDFGTSNEMWNFCIDRHNGAVNHVFMDWSARKVGFKELWKLKWHRQFNTDGTWTQAGGVQPTNWPKWMKDFKDY